jgi:hypothetical protein
LTPHKTELLKTEKERQAYIDPELSAKAREEGNAQFKVIVILCSLVSTSLIYDDRLVTLRVLSSRIPSQSSGIPPTLGATIIVPPHIPSLQRCPKH